MSFPLAKKTRAKTKIRGVTGDIFSLLWLENDTSSLEKYFATSKKNVISEGNVSHTLLYLDLPF